MKNNCHGCENIDIDCFPFTNYGGTYSNTPKESKHYIDMEGCGVGGRDDPKHNFLPIFYCPVCGRKISDD